MEWTKTGKVDWKGFRSDNVFLEIKVGMNSVFKEFKF